MSLPGLIEIVPLNQPVRAEITVPGSKSITNRALILAALAEGEVTLEGALWSEDTQIMVECLQELGFMINVQPDPNEACNRTITVYGKSGSVPPGGTERQPLELFVGNAGTAARFLTALVCLGQGVYRLHGAPRMHERPQAALFKALRELGYRVEPEQGNDRLPARIGADPSRPGDATDRSVKGEGRADRPGGPPARSCTVSIEESSQFASALLLGARTGNWSIQVAGENAEESPYVTMTSKMVERFPHRGGRFQIEPDASSGSYFLAAGTIAESPEFLEYSRQFGVEIPTRICNSIAVVGWPTSGWQVDQNFREFLAFGALLHKYLEFTRKGQPFDASNLSSVLRKPQTPGVSRRDDLGDSIMTAIMLAAEEGKLSPLHREGVHFTDLGRLRLQECERVAALRTELTKCGARVIEEGDTLTVIPSKLHGAVIETYDDHRMAMCFAILGLKVPGIKLNNPGCVKKTFPNFFQKLAAPPPRGLGATLLDGETGRALAVDELFAD